MVHKDSAPISVCLRLTQALGRTRTVDEIYAAALDALRDGLGVTRASILLFDRYGGMRFVASRGLSDAYKRAVEGHTPWRPDSPDPQPIVIEDVTRAPELSAFRPAIRAEGIAAMAFIPLISLGRVIGKFMLYYDEPRALTASELQLASIVAAQIAYAVDRTRAEDSARRSAERLRFALDAASMGTWDWDLASNQVQWSDNLERLHGLPPGTFDGSFASYEREIHPEDRTRVLVAQRRAIEDGAPYDVEYRIVAPDGTIQWVEGKGRVERVAGKSVRMTGVCMIATRRKEAELARLAAAEEANRLKDEFLATLSHELRTPLNAILGWVQMLQSGGLSAERRDVAVETIGRNARLQSQLIEDILDVSRIITGKLGVERQPLLVPALVDGVIAGVLPAAAAKAIEMTKDVPEYLPPIEGDPKRLQQVLGNILSNAIKFTPPGGRVAVGCAADDEAIAITVRDSGVGVDPEILPYIFDRFRQGDSRSTRKHGGLGLGLAIARHLLEQHGGEISAHSDGAGTGTTFRIALPIASTVYDIRPAAEPRPFAPPSEWRLDSTTVLVVDDQRDARELLAALFERSGAQVIQSESAVEALDILRSTTVQLLVADIAMPEVDGNELMRRARRADIHIPAIALSAYARPEDRRDAMTAGYNAYCPKPLDAAEFLRTVHNVLTAAAV
jgi:PAS domain S-box-containing protein